MKSSEKYNFSVTHIKKLRESFDVIFIDLLKECKNLKSRSAADPRLGKQVEVISLKTQALNAQLDSILQIYDLENRTDSYGDLVDISREIPGILNALKSNPERSSAVIETNFADGLPRIALHKGLFAQWMLWIFERLYRDTSVTRITVETTAENSKIVLTIVPEGDARSLSRIWSGLSWTCAVRFFEIQDCSLTDTGKGSLIIKFSLNGNDVPDILDTAFEEAKNIVNKIREGTELPTLSPVATKIVNLALNDSSSAQDIADVITIDPALTAKVIRVVNSPFYGFRKEITTLSQAVALLGMKAIRTLSLCVSIVNAFPSGSSDKFDYTGFWERSFAAAIACRLIAKKLKLDFDEEAFICGLTQNIGSLVLGSFYPEKAGRIIRKQYEQGVDPVSLELKTWGIDHTKVGYEVFNHWKMPAIFSETILYHHEPEKVSGRNSMVEKLARIVLVSDLVSQVLYEKEKGATLGRCKEEFRSLLGFSDNDIDLIMEQVSHETQTVAEEFDLKVDRPADYAEVLQSANRMLEIINLDYEQINRELRHAKEDAEKLAEELKMANKLLEEQAVTDGLTTLYNHRFFYEILQKEFYNARRYDNPLSCIMLDIDFFKKINDTYGHREGDKILKGVGRLFKKELREGDIAARYGGEEFALLLPNTHSPEAIQAAERIRKNVEETRFTERIKAGSVTISAGVSTFYQGNFKDYNILIETADRSLYKAKQTGRNRVVANNLPE